MTELSTRLESELARLADGEGLIRDMAMAEMVCRSVSREVVGLDLYAEPPELVDYRPEVDRVCVVVDVDDRPSDVLDEFIIRCRRSGYEPYISNPCFEIWLMMHFEAFDGMDRRGLATNQMVDGRRFTEVELDRIVRGINPENAYCKTDYDPRMFLHRTAEAISRSYGPCHDPRCLRREVGTNLGMLLEDMRGRRRGMARRGSLHRTKGDHDSVRTIAHDTGCFPHPHHIIAAFGIPKPLRDPSAREIEWDAVSPASLGPVRPFHQARHLRSPMPHGYPSPAG